jgi:hypothetical protein
MAMLRVRTENSNVTCLNGNDVFEGLFYLFQKERVYLQEFSEKAWNNLHAVLLDKGAYYATVKNEKLEITPYEIYKNTKLSS